MASTAVVTQEILGSVKRYKVEWTAHTDGTIDNELQDAAGNPIIFNGMLAGVTIIPGTGGDQPDDNYVMEILDDNDVNVLAAQGAALDETNTSDFCPMRTSTDGTTAGAVPFALASTLTLDGETAGSANTGTIYLYIS